MKIIQSFEFKKDKGSKLFSMPWAVLWWAVLWFSLTAWQITRDLVT